jgi:hypothetical protein
VPLAEFQSKSCTNLEFLIESSVCPHKKESYQGVGRVASIHRAAEKKNSANFALRGFSEVGYRSYLVLFRWLRRQSNNKSASIAVNAVKVPRLVPEGGVRPSTKPLGFVYLENSGS